MKNITSEEHAMNRAKYIALNGIDAVKVLKTMKVPYTKDEDGSILVKSAGEEYKLTQNQKTGFATFENVTNHTKGSGMIDFVACLQSGDLKTAKKFLMDNFEKGLKKVIDTKKEEFMTAYSESQNKVSEFEKYNGLKEKCDQIRIKDYLVSNYETDPKDKKNFRVNGDRISIEENKDLWYNHDKAYGGKGVISFEMKTQGIDFKKALEYITNNPIKTKTTKMSNIDLDSDRERPNTKAPTPTPENNKNISYYLRKERKIPEELVKKVIGDGLVYADGWQNACFVLTSLEGEKIGAALRGTTGQDNTYKITLGKKGIFDLPADGKDTKATALVESAIDALSLRTLGFKGRIISTTGSTSKENLGKIVEAIPADQKIAIAFNNDEKGLKMGALLEEVCTENNRENVKILPKNGKDFNEELKISYRSTTDHVITID